MTSDGKLTARECNFVHLDDSWKTYVRKEGELSKKWAEEWGFLPLQYQQLREDIDKSCGILTNHKSTLPSSFPPPLHLPPLTSPPHTTQLPFPKTTSREVGWRSSKKQLSLEVFGRWGRPKVSILRHLNWPHDAIA